MCYEEGRLMEFVDGETGGSLADEIEAHVSACAECAEAVTRLREDRAFAEASLTGLRVWEPTPMASREVTAASWPASSASVSSTSDETPVRRPGWSARIAEFGWGKAASIAIAVLALSSLGFAPVRSFASDVLRVFRVERIQTISLSAADLERISSALSGGEGHIDMEGLGEAWVDGVEPEAREVTLEEARAGVDFPVTLPDASVGSTVAVTLQSAATLKFKLKVAEVNKLLAYYGSERDLPKSLDGKVFEVKIPAVVLATYGQEDPDVGFVNPVTIGQARSPELIVPDGVNPMELRDVLVSLPLLPEHVRQQLASIDDWQHTLIVPSVGGSAREITIGGVPAVLMKSEETFEAGGQTMEGAADPDAPAGDRSTRPDEVAPPVTIIWQQDGVVRAVFAPGEKKAIAIAESMIR